MSLRRISAPVLALTGDKDLQVPPEDVHATGELVAGPFEGQVVRGVNHTLRPTPGAPDLKAYKAQARGPLDAQVVDRVTAWATAITGSGAPTSKTARGA